MTIRSVDWNGHCPDDDGPATAAEHQVVTDLEGYLRFTADRPDTSGIFQASIRADRARDAMVRDTLATYEDDGGYAA
ncbi:MAG: hypothetical protein JWO67_4073 [Streptosporangiaceae bacterium]|nr:hypothetical protein [Streptosporangiaceae bacterium]